MASRRMAALASYQLTPVRNRYASSRKKARKARSKFAPLRPLYSTALLQPSMIDFNPPSLFLQLLSFLLRHLPVMGRPVFRVPVLGNRPKYPDEPKALPMHHPPLRWDFHLPNRPIPLPIRIHPTVALQPGQEKLAEVLQRRIPAVHQHILRPKTPLPSFPQHLLVFPPWGLSYTRKSQGMRAFPSVQSKVQSAIPWTTRGCLPLQ
jgi:hypothetical protein